MTELAHVGRPTRTFSIQTILVRAGHTLLRWARTTLVMIAVGLGILVVAAVTASITAAATTDPGWLVRRSPLVPFLPHPGSGAGVWLGRTAALVGIADGPLVSAALLLRRSPAVPLAQVFAVVAVLLAPAVVVLTVWSLLQTPG